MVFKDLEGIIWLGPITMVTVYNVIMVTMIKLYTYHFQCLGPVLLILKSTQFLKSLIPISSWYLTCFPCERELEYAHRIPA